MITVNTKSSIGKYGPTAPQTATSELPQIDLNNPEEVQAA